VLARGGVPKLRALRLRNGTVWWWNRACYGVGVGAPHLRIENRVLPAGPTLLDEVANAAFFAGLLLALPAEYASAPKAPTGARPWRAKGRNPRRRQKPCGRGTKGAPPFVPLSVSEPPRRPRVPPQVFLKRP